MLTKFVIFEVHLLSMLRGSEKSPLSTFPLRVNETSICSSVFDITLKRVQRSLQIKVTKKLRNKYWGFNCCNTKPSLTNSRRLHVRVEVTYAYVWSLPLDVPIPTLTSWTEGISVLELFIQNTNIPVGMCTSFTYPLYVSLFRQSRMLLTPSYDNPAIRPCGLVKVSLTMPLSISTCKDIFNEIIL